jgi:glycosyltransferase involved in cell wall biosynthesis
MNPFSVGVVVTSHNHARFLKARLDTLMAQTYPDLDLWAIDDCSTENNVEILREYEGRRGLRLVLNERNAGLIPVMNQCLEVSDAPFLLIAQGDDECDPRMIERLMSALGNYPTAGLAFCRSALIDDHGRPLGDDYSVRERAFRRRCAEDALIPGSEMARFLLHSCVIPNMSAVLMRRQCLEGASGTFTLDYPLCVDWHWFFGVTESWDVSYVAEALNRFRQHAGSIRRRANDPAVNEYLRLLLPKARQMRLSWGERCCYRTRHMYLWAAHLLPPSLKKLLDVPQQLVLVWRCDPLALLFFTPAVVVRAFELVVKWCHVFSRRMSREEN